MFNEARLKLTLFYLIIIMVISSFFSSLIYQGAVRELNRLENAQRMRRPNAAFLIDPELISETKRRILSSLLILNLVIVGVSGLSGYFLSAKTLEPISKMLEKQKGFIGNASHELRTPLASLKSEIEVSLRDKKMKVSDYKRLLQSNLEDVDRMIKLSNYLLELNKFQDGKINKQKTDLAALIQKITKDIKEVKVTSSKSIVYCDPNSIAELVKILIDNGIKYNSNSEPKIDIVVKGKSLTITDNGIGIKDSDLPHIFERFYRGQVNLQTDGHGLGLAIVDEIVNLHNAKISVTSKLGKGTTFKVIFS